ncbi:MAG TPA: toll/interleukin-1 receptor domain-containing protein [Opitutaceae bacterium]|nr:toll/interleukin-1 receptor domain-containing protein [Opitutaceae bacterium]HRJ47383.1 toll/interleukin-1 receptor domain-containing protein [Opitutaceae bacterium]
MSNPLNVFISYSVHDTGLVDGLAAHLSPHATTRFWQQDKVPGLEAWPLIYSWIDAADLVVVVLTGATLSRGISVGTEVGYARKAGKRIIPLVAPEVPKGELGCLEGITYIRLDYDNPAATFAQLHSAIAHYKTAKAEQSQALVLVGLAVLGLFAFSRD